MFGRNADGELGLGSIGAPVQTPRLQQGFGADSDPDDSVVNLDVELIHISSGDGRTIAVTERGDVYAWGDNTDGSLGTGSTDDNVNVPARVAVLSTLDAVWSAVGNNTGFFIDEDNADLYAWGSGDNGLVGSNITRDSAALVGGQLIGVNVRRIYARRNHALALSVNGHVYTWGTDTLGQLGNGGASSDTVTSPQLVLWFLNNNFLAVGVAAVGEDFSAAVSNGDIYTWGSGANGRTGQNGVANTNEPTLITSFATAPDDFYDIVCGDAFCLALDISGDVFSWGVATCLGIAGDQVEPEVIARNGANDWVAFSAGSDHAILIDENGAVFVCGAGDVYQTGQGATAAVLDPTALTLDTPSAAISSTVFAAGDGSSFIYHPPVSCTGACSNGRCNTQGTCICNAGWEGDACDENVSGVTAETPTNTVLVTVVVVLGVFSIMGAAAFYVIRARWLRENELELQRIAKYRKLKEQRESKQDA